MSKETRDPSWSVEETIEYLALTVATLQRENLQRRAEIRALLADRSGAKVAKFGRVGFARAILGRGLNHFICAAADR